MPRFLTVALLLHIVLLPALLHADDFSDFRIPRHQVFTARASFLGNYSGSQSHQNLSSRSVSEDNSSLVGSLQPQSSWLYDSDPLRLAASLSGQFRGSTSVRRNSATDDHGSYRSERIQELLEQYQLDASTRAYPWQFPLGLDLSTTLTGRDRQFWNDRYFRDTDPDETSRDYLDKEIWSYDYYASGSASLGLGRVRNATSVYDVYALEERLREEGILTRPLLPATRQRLVDLLYLVGDYSSVHERPARFFWREVESTLNEDGGLRVEGLDAYTLYRIAEPYFARYGSSSSSPFAAAAPADVRAVEPRPRTSIPSYVLISGPSRSIGWFVGPTLRATHQHLVSRTQTRHSVEISNPDSAWLAEHTDVGERVSNSADDVTFGVRGEYHRPFGLRWQFDAASNLTHPYDDQHAIKGESFHFTSSGTLTRFVLDRWLLSASFSHQRYLQIRRQSNGVRESNSTWNTYAALDLNYYLEDHLSLSLTGQQNQGNRVYSNNVRYFDRTYEVFLGITYQLAGRLSAPGVAAPSSIFD